MRLSPAELQHFEREGYLVKPGVFAAADMDPIKRAIAAIVDTEARRLHELGELSDPVAAAPFETRLARIRDVDEEAARKIYAAILGRAGGGHAQLAARVLPGLWPLPA